MVCLFGHKWNGCKCTKCGKIRDESHDWNGCTCKICGKRRNEGHIFQKTEKPCIEKCSICGVEKHIHLVKDGKCEVCGEPLVPWSLYTSQEREILISVASLAAIKNPEKCQRFVNELSAESEFVSRDVLGSMVFGALSDAQMSYPLGSPERGLLDMLRKKTERIAYPEQFK